MRNWRAKNLAIFRSFPKRFFIYLLFWWNVLNQNSYFFYWQWFSFRNRFSANGKIEEKAKYTEKNGHCSCRAQLFSLLKHPILHSTETQKNTLFVRLFTAPSPRRKLSIFDTFLLSFFLDHKRIKTKQNYKENINRSTIVAIGVDHF